MNERLFYIPEDDRDCELDEVCDCCRGNAGQIVGWFISEDDLAYTVCNECFEFLHQIVGIEIINYEDYKTTSSSHT